jgi:hypothetical protein
VRRFAASGGHLYRGLVNRFLAGGEHFFRGLVQKAGGVTTCRRLIVGILLDKTLLNTGDRIHDVIVVSPFGRV